MEWTWIAVLAAVLGPGVEGVHGTIRSEGTGEPIEGVSVTVAPSSGATISDEDGVYAIRGLPAGRHRLHFSRFGYHDLRVEIIVPPGGALELDVRLRPRPIAMPAISVIAGRGDPTGAASAELGPLPPGSRLLSFSSARSDPLTREPDVLLSLDAVAGIDIAEESPTAFHVRGGSADQNHVLLDGIPVYNATHTSGVLSGVNPDAVSAVALHGGAMPARYGGRLSSVVDITTATPGRVGFELRGGLGPADMRTVVEASLPTGGGLLLAGRRTTYDLIERGDFDRNASSAFDEMLTKASIPGLGGELELLALHGTNWLAFFADPEAEDEAGDSLDRYNRVRWTTNTDAATWKGSVGDGTDLSVSAWRAGTHSRGDWVAGDDRIRLDHGLRHLGLRAEASRTQSWGSLRTGLGLERLATSYATRPISEDALPDSSRPSTIASTATSLSAFVEHRWIPHDRWLVDNGLRAVFGAGGGADLEPRVAVHHRPRPNVSLSVGYARLHQYAQSMRNEESVLNAAFGFEPLVSADDRVPVGRSDQVTASAQFQLAEGLRLELDAYARWLDGLVLVAPATAQPFAVDGFGVGRGTARGVGAALVHRGSTTDVDLVAEWGSATRRTGRLEYHPTFERRRSLAAAMTRRLGRQTSVRAAFRAAAGRPTSGLESGFEWEPFDRYTGEIEVGGTPLRRPGELNREKLPAYVRLDAGFRRTWRPSLLGLEGTLVTWLDILNLLGRRNALALEALPDSAGWYEIPWSRTSIAFGVDWSF